MREDITALCPAGGPTHRLAVNRQVDRKEPRAGLTNTDGWHQTSEPRVHSCAQARKTGFDLSMVKTDTGASTHFTELKRIIPNDSEWDVLKEIILIFPFSLQLTQLKVEINVKESHREQESNSL